jgi:hypothetical protein
MSFLPVGYPIRKKKGENVSIDMMNTNYDKQYKTEALVMLKKFLVFFYGEKYAI